MDCPKKQEQREAAEKAKEQQEGGERLIDEESAQEPVEVHHLESRLDLDPADEPPFDRPSAVDPRRSGYLLLLAIVVVVWYSAAL